MLSAGRPRPVTKAVNGIWVSLAASMVTWKNVQKRLSGIIFSWFWFSACFFTSQTTDMVMSGQSIHQNTLFSWASLTKRLTSTSCTHNACTDNNPSFFSRREENDRRNCFMINLHKSIGQDRDQTLDPWICNNDTLPTALPSLAIFSGFYTWKSVDIMALDNLKLLTHLSRKEFPTVINWTNPFLL